MFVDNEGYDKRVLLSIRKCRLLKAHKGAKSDRYIHKKWKDFQKDIDEVMKELQRKCDNLMQNKEALNATNVPLFMFIYSSLSKLQRISMSTHNDEHDENKDDESSPVIYIIQSSIKKLKNNVDENIQYICKSYSLNVMKYL